MQGERRFVHVSASHHGHKLGEWSIFGGKVVDVQVGVRKCSRQGDSLVYCPASALIIDLSLPADGSSRVRQLSLKTLCDSVACDEASPIAGSWCHSSASPGIDRRWRTHAVRVQFEHMAGSDTRSRRCPLQDKTKTQGLVWVSRLQH